MKRPAVLLLDEPLSSLDLRLRVQMQRVLKHIQQESGTTFVYVTHDQTEALAMSRPRRRHAATAGSSRSTSRPSSTAGRGRASRGLRRRVEHLRRRGRRQRRFVSEGLDAARARQPASPRSSGPERVAIAPRARRPAGLERLRRDRRGGRLPRRQRPLPRPPRERPGRRRVAAERRRRARRLGRSRSRSAGPPRARRCSRNEAESQTAFPSGSSK